MGSATVRTDDERPARASTGQSPPPASSPDNESWLKRVTSGRSSFFWLSLALGMLIALFWGLSPAGTFATETNAQSILEDSSVTLILAAAATMVIVGGGLDLSIGSVLTFGAVVGLLAMQEVGVERGWLAVGIGTAVGVGGGAAWGALNGALIAYARLSPFVVTLGSFGAALGAARLLGGGASPIGGPVELQDSIGLARIAGLPVVFVIAAGVVLVFGVILAYTRFGEHTYLVGSNEEAARRGGIRVRRHQLALYTLSGGLAGLAGIIDVARFDTASVVTGHTLELIAAIAAVIIGGASLAGGVGIMAGTVIGVFIPTVMNNGFVVLGVQRFWQDVAVGVILVVAVAFDEWRRRADLRAR